MVLVIMAIKKIVQFAFCITVLLLNSSIVAENTLKASIAKLMNVEPKQIDLKKQTDGITSTQNYSFELNEKNTS